MADEFMILDAETGDAVAFFDEESDAEAALIEFGTKFADEADRFALVRLDDEGFAIGRARFASDLIPA
ncbi:MAG TPA: hypothetical protein VID47_07870 [Actinomycetota bacterium]|jgi:hypothetical protein